MSGLVFQSICFLVWTQILLSFRGLSFVHKMTHERLVNDAPNANTPSVDQMCHAMDVACVLYYKRVLCLQRSIATALFLKAHGSEAHLLIGAQMFPFEYHAWVEIRDAVINDKPYMRDIYQVLERC